MDVPSSCKKYMSPHSKNVLHITRAITSFTISKGKPSRRVRLSSQRAMTWMVCWVSMLVYIDVAPAVNSQELGNIFPTSLILANICALPLM